MVPRRKSEVNVVHTSGPKPTTIWTSNTDTCQRDRHENEELEPEEPPRRRIPRLQDVAVACSAFLNIFMSIGFPYSLGVLYDDLMFTFHVGRKDVTMVIALCTGILSAAGAVAGIFVNKFGLRITLFVGVLLGSCGGFASAFATGVYFLVVSLGILTGLGYSLVYVSTLVALGKYFPSDNSTVIVFSTMGSAVGIMILPIVITELMEHFGWRGSLIIMSGICLNSFVFSLLLTLPAPVTTVKIPETAPEEKKKSVWFDFTIFRSKDYVLYLVVLSVISGSITSAIITLPDIIRTRGFTLKNSAFFLSVESIADVVGRLFYCQLSCFKRLTSKWLFFAASILFSVSLIVFPKLYGTIPLYSGTCFIGITAGMILSVYNLVVLDIIGPEKYATAMGFAESMCGIGNIIFGVVIGYLGEASNSFDSGIYLLGLVSVAISVFVSIMQMPCFQFRCCKSSPKEQTANEVEGQDNQAFTRDTKITNNGD